MSITHSLSIREGKWRVKIEQTEKNAEVRSLPNTLTISTNNQILQTLKGFIMDIRTGFPQKFCDAFVGSNRDNYGNRQDVTVSQDYKDVLEEVKARRDAMKNAKANKKIRDARRNPKCAKKGDSLKQIYAKCTVVKKSQI